MGRKKQEMDQLTIDSANAIKAGMSYGKYMAMKGPVKVTPTVPTGYYHICQQCGKEFYVSDKKHRKYCSDRCRELSYYVPKEEKLIQKTCPICGKEFTAKTNYKKYCSEFCANVAKGQKIREYQARKKEEKANG